MTDLRLGYGLRTTPYPVLAAADGKTRLVDLDFQISRVPGDSVTLKQIEIDIPAGSTQPGALTALADLPTPKPAESGGWTIERTGGTITLLPQTGEKLQFTEPVQFTVPGVRVNESAGHVVITLSEYPPEGDPVFDNGLLSIDKWPAGFQVTEFKSVPPALRDLEKTVTLYWTVVNDPEGQLSFNVHSDNWPGRNCLQGRQCYTAAEGASGVTTPKLSQGTRFALDLIEMGSDHKLEIRDTLYLDVPLTVPWVDPHSCHYETSCGSRIATLHWVAGDADACDVTWDGNAIDTGAPLDVYDDGRLEIVPTLAGVSAFEVTARAAGTSASDSQRFRDLSVPNPRRISIGAPIVAIAVAGAARLAVAGNGSGTMHVVNLDSGSSYQRPADGAMLELALTPSGVFALYTSTGQYQLRTLGTADSPIGAWGRGIGVDLSGVAIAAGVGGVGVVPTLDGRVLLLDNVDNGGGSQSWQQLPAGAAVGKPAIRADGGAAMVGGDLTKQHGKPGRICGVSLAQPRAPIDTGSPDGCGPCAYAIGSGDLLLALPDGTLGSMTIGKGLGDGRTPLTGKAHRIVPLPGGRLVAVATDHGVEIVDLRRSRNLGTLPLPQATDSIAVTPKGELLVADGGDILVLDFSDAPS